MIRQSFKKPQQAPEAAGLYTVYTVARTLNDLK